MVHFTINCGVCCKRHTLICGIVWGQPTEKIKMCRLSKFENWTVAQPKEFLLVCGVYLFLIGERTYRYLSSCYVAFLLGLKPKMTSDQQVTAVCDETTTKLMLDGDMIQMLDPDSEGWMGGMISPARLPDLTQTSGQSYMDKIRLHIKI